MAYQAITLRDLFRVRQIVTVHYFEYGKNYVFTGEQHDFWEFVYVDRGEVDVLAANTWSRLRQGQMVFHCPGEFHNIRATGEVAPNLVVVSFVCKSAAMQYFQGKTIWVRDAEKRLLGELVGEAEMAFSSHLGDPFLQKQERSAHPRMVGSEQVIRLNLERLLLSLYRGDQPVGNTTLFRQRVEDGLAQDIMVYLQEHLGERITLTQLAETLHVSLTAMKEAFRKQKGMGIMACFTRMKMERAKVLIREDAYNITQIAALLGYDSIHHFSRRFKAVTGLSPTEYARSVKAIQEGKEA